MEVRWWQWGELWILIARPAVTDKVLAHMALQKMNPPSPTPTYTQTESSDANKVSQLCNAFFYNTETILCFSFSLWMGETCDNTVHASFPSESPVTAQRWAQNDSHCSNAELHSADSKGVSSVVGGRPGLLLVQLTPQKPHMLLWISSMMVSYTEMVFELLWHAYLSVFLSDNCSHLVFVPRYTCSCRWQLIALLTFSIFWMVVPVKLL